MKSFNAKGGYTLLFAVLTAALVLGVTVFILQISRKQFILSTTARESTFAIYAADSGIECIALLEANISIDPTDDWLKQFDCNGKTIRVPEPSTVAAPPGFQDPVNQTPQSGAPDKIFIPLERKDESDESESYGCAIITIQQGPGLNGNTRTVIESRGYNLCDYSPNQDLDDTWDDGPDVSNKRTVERALRLIYD